MDNADAMAEKALCAFLRAGPVARQASDLAQLEAGLRASAANHGVGPLLARQLSFALPRDGRLHALPGHVQQLKDAAAIELARKYQLVRILSALAEAGVTPLLLKGAALAYSIYPSPALRPRADTDLLIRSVDRTVADRILLQLGYEKSTAINGKLVSYQCGYAMRDRFGIDHVLDVHWRISNTQLFSRVLDYQELKSRSVPIAKLGKHARGLGLADALLHACMHRAHHMHSAIHVDGIPQAGGERLIWLYDIHLLVSAMSFGDRGAFARLAELKSMRAICRDGLLRARQCFGTEIHQELLMALTREGPAEPSEAHLLSGGVRHLLTELRSLPRWRERVSLLREHLFPPADYMLEKYAATSSVWLPVLYLKRAVSGAWKRMQNS